MAVIDNLIAYWSLDEASGNAIDAHGSNDLVDQNTVGSAAGKVANARDFEFDLGEFFSLADNTDLSTGDINFTFNCWVWIESFATEFPFVAQKGFGSDNNANQEWALYRNGVGTPFRFHVGFGTSTASVDASTFGNPPTGTWMMVTCWHDATGNQLGIAVNAGTADTAAHSGGVNDGTRSFFMGARWGSETPTGDLKWDGLIDEAGFWKRVLTADERTWLYNSGNGRSYADIQNESSSVELWSPIIFVVRGPTHNTLSSGFKPPLIVE